MKPLRGMPRSFALGILAICMIDNGKCATAFSRYYGHQAVHDDHGVIAPWYSGLNGQCDFRVRIAAETLKRYPWTTTSNAVAAYPHYVFSGVWQIASNGVITPKTPSDWANADIGQRATSLLNGWVDYYRYTGDPAAIAHATYMADFLIDWCQTPANHPWPGLFISVPVKGKAYGRCDPNGMIQLDLCGSAGLGLLRAYQLTGNRRWFDTARHWAELLAARCNLNPAADPWPRYANPEAAPWKDNKQTGGVTMILSFLDELIRLSQPGPDGSIIAARDAGRRYLRDRLLPAWTTNDTWGRYFWDWANPVQNCLTTPDAAGYLLDHPDVFPNWRTDARNILTLFLNHSSVAPESGGDVYSGAWAYPEANNCCGRSLWYAPLCVAPTIAHWAVLANSEWGRELAYRQLVLQTYDIHSTGVSEDNIEGGTIVNGDWFNIAHPMAFRFVLSAIGWLPKELGASRENHIVRSTAVVSSITYGAGRIRYSTFDAPAETMEVLRLSFTPKSVRADGRWLRKRAELGANGYAVEPLPNGDCILSIRHDGLKRIEVTGPDPQQVIPADAFVYEGGWTTVRDRQDSTNGLRLAETAEASMTARFNGNQVRLVGGTGAEGGLAEIYLDGVRQLVPLDCWNPQPRSQQVLWFRNGLDPGAHELRLQAMGAHNPYSAGNRIYVEALQFSAADKAYHFPTGTGPREAQRMIFGYAKRADYRDAQGHLWRPATEFVIRLGAGRDSVAESWWTAPATHPIDGTPDPELYRYGAHGREFWVNLTVGPGDYYAKLKFAATHSSDKDANWFSIFINGRKVLENFDVTATAGGPNRATDLVFNDLIPLHGAIEVRFKGNRRPGPEGAVQDEAFLQALEIGPGRDGRGGKPVSHPAPSGEGNLLLNPGFEATVAGTLGGPGIKADLAGWTCEFLGPAQSYIWQEQDYRQHPDWGLPEIHTGKGAIRTHTDSQGHTRISQEIEVNPNTRYTASAWVKTVDLKGKGFGHDPRDSAGLLLQELDSSGRMIREHEKLAVREMGPYRRLSTTLETEGGTAVVRFILDTVMHCHYEEGHATYDDCCFTAARPPSMTTPADRN